MNKFILLFVFSVAFSVSSIASASVCTVEKESANKPEKTTCEFKTASVDLSPRFLDRKILYAVPSSPKPKAGYPVVFMFQGSFFEVEFSRSEGLPFGGYNEIKLIEELLNRGFAVIAPRAFKKLFWSSNTPILSKVYDIHADKLLMERLLQEVEEGKYGPLDSKNIFATGISSGGYQSSRVGIEFPGRFNALAVQSASFATCLGPLCDIPDKLSIDHPPTLLLHGAEDATVPLWTAEKYFEVLQKNGITSEIHINPKAGHEWLVESPKMIADYFTQFKK